ncbi:MAG: hypothetical protein AVDCRST_MAG85-1485 [uncultured Solirubrobacteraceae bacterium]|uniref:Uncharacterized protein n=1 Tax=uncultured Solirubrobacteraceae bacterium TaxID=1162706 RepID=A0A6J4SML0_9ACTN|nr:MAG: hypothetical protein AVDCRST_MAG85-1485 [uncultured Solirubrobacteraceae bacterium]
MELRALMAPRSDRWTHNCVSEDNEVRFVRRPSGSSRLSSSL